MSSTCDDDSDDVSADVGQNAEGGLYLPDDDDDDDGDDDNVSAGVGQYIEGGLCYPGMSTFEGSVQQGLVSRLQIRP